MHLIYKVKPDRAPGPGTGEWVQHSPHSDQEVDITTRPKRLSRFRACWERLGPSPGQMPGMNKQPCPSLADRLLAAERVWWFQARPLDTYDEARHVHREAQARDHWLLESGEYGLRRCRPATMFKLAGRHNRAVRLFRADASRRHRLT